MITIIEVTPIQPFHIAIILRKDFFCPMNYILKILPQLICIRIRLMLCHILCDVLYLLELANSFERFLKEFLSVRISSNIFV